MIVLALGPLAAAHDAPNIVDVSLQLQFEERLRPDHVCVVTLIENDGSAERRGWASVTDFDRFEIWPQGDPTPSVTQCESCLPMLAPPPGADWIDGALLQCFDSAGDALAEDDTTDNRLLIGLDLNNPFGADITNLRWDGSHLGFRLKNTKPAKVDRIWLGGDYVGAQTELPMVGDVQTTLVASPRCPLRTVLLPVSTDRSAHVESWTGDLTHVGDTAGSDETCTVEAVAKDDEIEIRVPAAWAQSAAERPNSMRLTNGAIELDASWFGEPPTPLQPRVLEGKAHWVWHRMYGGLDCPVLAIDGAVSEPGVLEAPKRLVRSGDRLLTLALDGQLRLYTAKPDADEAEMGSTSPDVLVSQRSNDQVEARRLSNALPGGVLVIAGGRFMRFEKWMEAEPRPAISDVSVESDVPGAGPYIVVADGPPSTRDIAHRVLDLEAATRNSGAESPWRAVAFVPQHVAYRVEMANGMPDFGVLDVGALRDEVPDPTVRGVFDSHGVLDAESLGWALATEYDMDQLRGNPLSRYDVQAVAGGPGQFMAAIDGAAWEARKRGRPRSFSRPPHRPIQMEGFGTGWLVAWTDGLVQHLERDTETNAWEVLASWRTAPISCSYALSSESGFRLPVSARFRRHAAQEAWDDALVALDTPMQGFVDAERGWVTLQYGSDWTFCDQRDNCPKGSGNVADAPGDRIRAVEILTPDGAVHVIRPSNTRTQQISVQGLGDVNEYLVRILGDRRFAPYPIRGNGSRLRVPSPDDTAERFEFTLAVRGGYPYRGAPDAGGDPPGNNNIWPVADGRFSIMGRTYNAGDRRRTAFAIPAWLELAGGLSVGQVLALDDTVLRRVGSLRWSVTTNVVVPLRDSRHHLRWHAVSLGPSALLHTPPQGVVQPDLALELELRHALIQGNLELQEAAPSRWQLVLPSVRLHLLDPVYEDGVVIERGLRGVASAGVRFVL